MNTATKAAVMLAATGVAIGASAGAASALGGAKGHGGESSGGGCVSAQGTAVKSPGLISGNNLQVPVAIPINLTGNSVNLVGLLNPTFGNSSANCV